MDEFTTAYAICALWSSTDESREDGGDPIDANYGLSDLHSDTVAQFEKDCAAFQEKHGSLIKGREAGAGHDFWLTRNGHGAGFWDGDWPEPAATVLTEGSEAAGTTRLYIGDDGKIYTD